MKRQPIRHHPFTDSGYTDGTSKPQRICGTCHSVESYRAHDLPPTTPEAQALDARLLGENKEHQTT